MLVEHQPVEAHLLGVHFLVEVSVVELGAQLRVVDFVADGQVHNGLAGGAEIAGPGVLIGPFREVSDKHTVLPPCFERDFSSYSLSKGPVTALWLGEEVPNQGQELAGLFYLGHMPTICHDLQT